MGVTIPKANYFIFHPADDTTDPDKNVTLDKFAKLTNDGFITVSIDVAIKNFAICIEKRTTNAVENLKFEVVDFTKIGTNTAESSGTAAIDPVILRAAYTFLDSLSEYWTVCDLIGVERQMATNPKSSRMFQHVISYFMMYYRARPELNCILIDINPKLKGRVLNAPKNLNYKGLKAWSIKKAADILEMRQDDKTRDLLLAHDKTKGKIKADDLADTICQMEALILSV